MTEPETDVSLIPPPEDLGTFFEPLKTAKIEYPDQPSPVGENYRATIDLQPDAAADILKLAEKSGEHPAFIQQNAKDLKSMAEAPSEDELQMMKRLFPVTHKHLSSPTQFATAKDDIESLKTIEQTVSDDDMMDHFWNGMKWATKNLASSLFSMASQATQAPRVLATTGALAANKLVPLQTLGAVRPNLKVPEWLGFEDSAAWWDEKAKEYATPQLSESALLELGKGNFDEAGKIMAAKTIAATPMLASFVVGNYLGAVTPMLAGMGLLTAGGTYRRNVKAGLTQDASTANALANAGIQTVAMRLGTLGPLKGGIAEVAAKYGKDSAAKVASSFVRTIVNSYIGGAAQGGAMAGGGAIVDAVSGLPIPKLGDLLLGIGDEMLTMGVQNMAVIGPSAVIQGVHRASSMRRAEMIKNTYIAMGDTVQAAKLYKRLPTQLKAYVEEVTAGRRTNEVMINADGFERILRQEGLDPEKIAGDLGVSEQYETQKGPDQFLTIKTSEFADKVPAELIRKLGDDIKAHPEQRTVNEERAITQTEMRATIDQANALSKEVPGMSEGMEAIYQDMVAKQKTSGAFEGFDKAEQLIDANARVFAAEIAIEAANRGIDPKVYYTEVMKPIEITTAKPPAEGGARLQSAKEIASHEEWRYYEPERTGKGTLKGAPELTPTARHLPHLRASIRKLVQEGVPGRHWFRDVADTSMKVTGNNIVDADRLLQLMAIYSPHQRVFQNTQNAIKVFTDWKNGVPRDKLHAATGVQDEAARALLYDGKEWVGRKTNSFYKNMLHELIAKATPEDITRLGIDPAFLADIRKPVTVDVWMLRAFGYMNAVAADDLGTGKYSFVENEVRRIAAELNSRLAPGEEPWEPHQVQAAIWTAIKARHEIPDVVRRTKEKSVKLGLSKMEGGKWAAPTTAEAKRKHAAIWREYALAAAPEVAAESVKGAKTSFADVIRRSTINVTWEAVPSASLGLEITKASPAVRAAFTSEVAPIFLDILAKIKLHLGTSEPGTGGYAQTINPNMILGLLPAKPAGPFDLSKGDLAARIIQYVTRQDAVPFFRADPSAKFTEDFAVLNKQGKVLQYFEHQADAEAFAKTTEGRTVKGGKFAHGVMFRFNKSITYAVEEAFFEQLRQSLNQDAGYTKLNDREIAVINFRDDATGLPFSNDVEFLTALDRMGAEHGQRLGIEAGDTFGSEGKYGPVHDWGKDSSGEVLFSETALKDAPDLHEWIRGRRALYDEIVKRYSGEELKVREAELQTLERLTPAEVRLQSGNLNPDDARGWIGQMPEKTVIGLPKADPSTFAHEEFHGWVDRLVSWVDSGQASPADVEQLNTLRKFAGAKEGEPISKAGHEKLAKAQERYLGEGIAPSEYLQQPFARYARWITNVYRSLDELGAELSPEMRAVFDRRLASEDQIAFARQQQGLDIVSDPQNLDPAVKAKLTKLRQEAHDEAVRELTVKQMKELSQERKEFLAAEETKARKAATDEVSKQREYTAMESVQRSMKKDAKELSQLFVDGKLTDEQDTSYRMLAQLNGYENAETMAHTLLNTPSLKDAIQQRVDAHMEQHADLRSREEIRLEAMKAVHNEKAVELLANEQALFQSLVDEAQGRAEQAKMRRVDARIAAAAAKKAAFEYIASSKVRDAMSFMRYFTAERKAALEAQQAMADGQFQKAADAKTVQMRNHALAIQAFHAREAIFEWRDYLHKITLMDRALFKREEHFNQIGALLSRFAGGRDDFDPATRTETLAEWHQRLLDRNEAVAIDPWLFDESVAKPFSELTVMEAATVVNAIKNIRHMANAEHSFYKLWEGAVVLDKVKTLIDEALRFGKAAPPPEAMKPPKGKLEAVKDFAEGYGVAIRSMENMFWKLGGGREDSQWMSLHRAAHDAGDVESRMWTKTFGLLDKTLADHYSVEDRLAMMDFKKAVFIPEFGTSLRRIELLMMALNTGNEINRKRLFGTKNVGLKPTGEWGEDFVMSTLNKYLKANDWRAVQGIWDTVSSIWPDIKELHKRLTGFAPERVEPQPFRIVTPEGEIVDLKGGYFPLKYDYREDAAKQVKIDIESPLYESKDPVWYAATKQGHLKPRMAEVKAPVDIADSSILHRHLRDAIHDYAFRELVIDMNRLVANPDLANTVRSIAGDDQFSALRDWVKELAGQNQRNKLDWPERALRAAQKNFGLSLLVFNPRIVAQNLSNILLYARAIPEYGWKDYVLGNMHYIGFYHSSLLGLDYAKQFREFVYGKSAWMRDKRQSPDLTMQQTVNRLAKGNKTMAEYFFNFFSASDELTSMVAWRSAYDKAIAMNKSEADAVYMADQVVSRSIGAARKAETPPIFRGSALGKSLAQFQIFMNAQQQRWERERVTLKQDYFKNAPAFAGYFFAHFVAFAALSNIFSGNLPSFEDKRKMKKWLLSTMLYRFNMLPLINGAANTVASYALHLPTFGYRPIPSLDVPARLVQGAVSGVGGIQGRKPPAQAIEDVTHAVAMASGTPDEFLNLFWNAYDIATGKMGARPEDLIRRRPRRER